MFHFDVVGFVDDLGGAVFPLAFTCGVFLVHCQSIYPQGGKNNGIKRNRHSSDIFHMNQSFTCRFNGITKYLITDAEIEPVNKTRRIKIKALWDTGVNRTVITSRIVEKLRLEPFDSGFLGTVSDEKVPVNLYKVNMHLRGGIEISGIEVIDGALGGHYDVLVGMDIMSQGDIAFSNFDGKTTFIFRMPSVGEFHYGKLNDDKVGRNDLCPCGSGKKHKRCCGAFKT